MFSPELPVEEVRLFSALQKSDAAQSLIASDLPKQIAAAFREDHLAQLREEGSVEATYRDALARLAYRFEVSETEVWHAIAADVQAEPIYACDPSSVHAAFVPVQVNFRYTVPLIPTRRHRRVYEQEFSGAVTVYLPSVTSDDAPVAIRAWAKVALTEDRPGVAEYRYWNGRLYARFDVCDTSLFHLLESMMESHYYPPIGNVYTFSSWSRYYFHQLESISQWAQETLLIDGAVWRVAPEPVWQVCWFRDRRYLKLVAQWWFHGTWAQHYRLDQKEQAIADYGDDLIVDLDYEVDLLRPEALKFERGPKICGDANVATLKCGICGNDLVLRHEVMRYEYTIIHDGIERLYFGDDLPGRGATRVVPFCPHCHTEADETGYLVRYADHEVTFGFRSVRVEKVEEGSDGNE